MKENIIDRDKLQDALIESIIDGMDHKTMYAYVYDSLNGNFDDYSMKELIQETEEYYPELLIQNYYQLLCLFQHYYRYKYYYLYQ